MALSKVDGVANPLQARMIKARGLRTFPLVAIAGCGFIHAAENLTSANPETPAPVAAITGISPKRGDIVTAIASTTRSTAAGLLGICAHLSICPVSDIETNVLS